MSQPDHRQISSPPRVSARAMGHEKQPLIVIDNAFHAADDLRRLAARTPFLQPHTLYPGLNAPVPRAYGQSLIHMLRPMLDEVFGLPTTYPLNDSAFFALGLGEAMQLQPLQKIPHHDTSDPFILATVHYLCDGQGGTGFFRHIPTGYEYIDDSRFVAYERLMRAELAHLPADIYAGGDTPNYELIDQVDAVFNRVIIYRTTSLHSGLLSGSRLSADPLRGRLTINTIISPARPHQPETL